MRSFLTNSSQESHCIRASRIRRCVAVVLALQVFAMNTFGQKIPLIPNTDQDLTWWYVLLGFLIFALYVAIRWVRSSKAKNEVSPPSRVRQHPSYKAAEPRMPSAPNRSREIEWLRQNPTETEKVSHLRRDREEEIEDEFVPERHFEDEEPREKTFRDFPVARFDAVVAPAQVDELPESDDPRLLDAIAQTIDGAEYDEEVRLVATRVLAMFRAKNALEALQKIALYDISSNVRSKAVSILADFDHESVFETIVVASADPSRDVRAAAARALTRLNIDRADAWARVALSGDEFRISQVARAAIECEIVIRSVDRLVHDDKKIAYEAFVLFALLAKAGETATIFDLITNEEDVNVKLALIKVLECARDDRFISGLVNIGDDFSLPVEVRNAAEQTARRIAASKE